MSQQDKMTSRRWSLEEMREIAKVKDIGYSQSSNQFTGYSLDRAILRAALKELDAALAEVERLKTLNLELNSGAICHICYDYMDEDSKNMTLTLEREINAKLTEALEKIPHASDCEYWNKCTCEKQTLAQAEQMRK
jgi:hypothetical protein